MADQVSAKRAEVIAGLAELGRRMVSPICEGGRLRIVLDGVEAYDAVVTGVAEDGTLTVVPADAWQPSDLLKRLYFGEGAGR